MTSGQATPEVTQGQAVGPRKLQRIACAYQLGTLPMWWVVLYRRMRMSIERLGFEIRVELTPVSRLSPDVDLVIVPPELMAMAGGRASQAECVAIAFSQYPQAVMDLVASLGDEQRYQVPRFQTRSGGEAAKGKIVRHMGAQRLA